MQFTNKNKFDLDNFSITAEIFHDKKNAVPKPLVIDLRTAEEYNANHINGAVNLPAAEVEDSLYQLPPFGEFYLYSNSEDAGIDEVGKLLFDNQFTEFYYIKGGYEAILSSSIEITEAAKEVFKKHTSEGIVGIGIDYNEGKLGLSLKKNETTSESEVAFDANDVRLFVSSDNIRFLNKTVLDAADGELSINNPAFEGDIKKNIQGVLDEKVNPMVAQHGGVINLLDVKDDNVYIEMGGGCQGCASSSATLKQGVEGILRENFPQINDILDVTDHANGDNPYFRG